MLRAQLLSREQTILLQGGQLNRVLLPPTGRAYNYTYTIDCRNKPVFSAVHIVNAKTSGNFQITIKNQHLSIHIYLILLN